MPPKKTMSFEEWKKSGKPSGLTAKPKPKPSKPKKKEKHPLAEDLTKGHFEFPKFGGGGVWVEGVPKKAKEKKPREKKTDLPSWVDVVNGKWIDRETGKVLNPESLAKKKLAIQKRMDEIDRIWNDDPEGAKKYAEALSKRKRYTEAEARTLQAKDAEMKKKKKEPVKKKEPAPVKMKQMKKIRKIMKDTRSGKKEKYKPTLETIKEEPKKKKFVVKKK